MPSEKLIKAIDDLSLPETIKERLRGAMGKLSEKSRELLLQEVDTISEDKKTL